MHIPMADKSIDNLIENGIHGCYLLLFKIRIFNSKRSYYLSCSSLTIENKVMQTVVMFIITIYVLLQDHLYSIPNYLQSQLLLDVS